MKERISKGIIPPYNPPHKNYKSFSLVCQEVDSFLILMFFECSYFSFNQSLKVFDTKIVWTENLGG